MIKYNKIQKNTLLIVDSTDRGLLFPPFAVILYTKSAQKEIIMDMLHITDLHKKFGDKEVLNGLSLAVPEHSIYGFIGKNGSGKTTTMKTVLGLLRPDSGEITVNGEKVVYGQTATNKYIGYLPDVPEFYSFMTATEYLRFCGEISGIVGADNDARVAELLTLVGLADEKHRIKGFSRGMKQRLGIAQALLNKPKLLICDEPTSALDPVGRREILDILSSVRDQTTVLFSTHILSDVERICTDVAFLNNGVIEIQGKLADIKARFRGNEYQIQTENEADILTILSFFTGMKRTDATRVIFREGDYNVADVLRFVADNGISIVKIERMELGLEELFMEVNGK